MWSEKRVWDILGYEQNRERIYYILKEQGVIMEEPLNTFMEQVGEQGTDSVLSEFVEEVEKQGIVKTLKKYMAYKQTGTKNTVTTWCNPYIWILVSVPP